MHRVQPARATRLLAAARPTGRTYANPTLALGTQTWVTHALGQHGPNGVASRTPSRPIFNLFNRLTGRESKPAPPPQPVPVLSQDDLFHPFSKSPFPAIRARGEAISQMAPCPVCSSEHGHEHGHTHGHGSGNENKNAAEQTETDLENELENGPLRPKPTPVKTVKFECPDCGWPTHCSEEHWKADPEHEKYCARLREVNEDEHDLRSGRRIREFELPAEQDSEAAISFSNWDVFWYTRQFPSMDTERARRHASKLLTYPMTIGSILHQYSGLTLSNQRLTPEGSRSLAALRSTLHVKPGTPETAEAAADKPQVRVFILGARAESSLPAHVWEQLTMLFPSGQMHLHFIGPQVSLPQGQQPQPNAGNASSSSSSAGSSSTTFSSSPTGSGSGLGSGSGSTSAPPTDAVSSTDPSSSSSPSSSVPTTNGGDITKPLYLPNVYTPPTPKPITALKRTRSSLPVYGVPSYTTPYTPALTLTGLQTSYMSVHAQFQDTFDPYTDVFFLFSPGFGFPSPDPSSIDAQGNPLLQIASPTEWGPVLPTLLASKCPIFVTGFSPADVERDVKSLATAPGVAGEFDWLLTPGPNTFGSDKWEVADFDPRVMVKTNWGVWGIRGKRRDVRERSGFKGLFGGL